MFVLKIPPLDQALVRKALKRFEWLISFLICRFRFVHQILGMMTKTANNIVPTMGVRVLSGARFDMVYNPAFVETLSDEEATFVLYHEVLHLVLHHCTTRRFDNHEVWNLATDAAVNELIPVIPGSCERPKTKKGDLCGVFVDELRKETIFKDIKNKQTSEWYYDFFMKHLPPQSKDGGRGGKGKNQGKGKDALGKPQMDDHGGWKENEIADEKVRAKVDEIAKSDLWGTVSAADKEMIMAAQSRKINWRNFLRRFHGNQVWNERETTRKRPNRRTGFAHPGFKKIHVDRHLVATDTSGSIDSGLLAEFLSVINGATDFIPIDMMQFDWDKTSDPRPFDRKLAKFEFSGRGGTNFQPVIDIVNERRYKSVIILTDGEAAPPSRPKNAKVLWVLPMGHNPPVDWGQRIHMKKHA